MKPTDEQIKWFWEQCGFVKRGRSYSGQELWVAPEDIEWFDQCVKDVDNNGYARLPEKDKYYALPPIDLNNLFKYAVPAFKKHCASRPDYADPKHCDNDIHIFLRLCEGKGWTEKGWMCSLKGFRTISNVEGIEDPALALFWAIYKAFGGKE